MRKHGMKARVAEIKAENAAKCEMSKEEYRAYLMKTPAGQIGPDHQFCQIYKVVDENGVTRLLRAGNKGSHSRSRIAFLSELFTARKRVDM